MTLEDGLIERKGIYTIKKEGNKLDIAFLNPEDPSEGLPALSTDKYELQNSTEPTVENKIRYITVWFSEKQTEETTQEQTQEQTQQSSSELTTESRSTEDSKRLNTTKEESLPPQVFKILKCILYWEFY